MNFPMRLAHSVIPKRLHWFFHLKHSEIHGRARWMNGREMQAFLSGGHDGLALGAGRRLSREESCKNLVLLAPTGSGKTTRYVIPNLLQLTGSAVVTDPSGEIYRATSGALARRGYRIQVLQPAAPQASLGFNPLACFGSPQELRRLATILCESGETAERFWTIGAVNILTLCLKVLSAIGDTRYLNLANARWLLNHIGTESETVRRTFARFLGEADFADFAAFLAQDPKVSASLLSSARAALDLWSDPEVARLTAAHTVEIERLRRQETVIYLIVPEHKIRYFSVILNLFYTACFEHCLSAWDEGDGDANARLLPVSFFLDEFGNLGRIDNFAGIITTLRKRRCSVSLILQERAQLEALYGRLDAQTIFSGGCGHKLFFSGLDAETCRSLEQALGQNTVYDTYYEGVSEHARVLGVPLKRADEIRMLPPDQAILLSGREPPALLTIPPYYRVPELLEQSQMSPFPLPQGAAGAVSYLPLEGRPSPELEASLSTLFTQSSASAWAEAA